MRSRITWGSVFLLYFSLITIQNAHAYIDPQSGSYIFQAIVGGVLAAGVAIRVFWSRIWGFITRKNSRSGGDEPGQTAVEAETELHPATPAMTGAGDDPRVLAEEPATARAAERE